MPLELLSIIALIKQRKAHIGGKTQYFLAGYTAVLDTGAEKYWVVVDGIVRYSRDTGGEVSTNM